MTGDQKHRNDIINGQQLNRHADRPYVIYFFRPRFLKTIFSQPASGSFGFAQTKCITLKYEFFKHKQLIELSN